MIQDAGVYTVYSNKKTKPGPDQQTVDSIPDIWTIKFNPTGGLYDKKVEERRKSTKNKPQARDQVREENFKFCKTKNEIGIGWSGLNKKQMTEIANGYPKDSVRIYKEKIQKHIDSENWNEEKYQSGKTAIRQIQKIKKGHIIWTEIDNKYYLGIVKAEYRYRNDFAHWSRDVVRTVSVHRWKGPIIYEKSPGAVSMSLTTPRTIKRITDNKKKAVFYLSYYLKPKGYKKMRKPDPIKTKSDFFKNFDQYEMENIVGLYLQSEEGYKILPATKRSNTPDVEWFMIKGNKRAKIYGVQVKSGNQKIDKTEKELLDMITDQHLERLHIFTAEEPPTFASTKIPIITHDVLWDFIKKGSNCDLLHESQKEQFKRMQCKS